MQMHHLFLGGHQHHLLADHSFRIHLAAHHLEVQHDLLYGHGDVVLRLKFDGTAQFLLIHLRYFDGTYDHLLVAHTEPHQSAFEATLLHEGFQFGRKPIGV